MQHEAALEAYKRVAKAPARIFLRGDEVIMEEAQEASKLTKLKQMALKLRDTIEEDDDL